MDNKYQETHVKESTAPWLSFCSCEGFEISYVWGEGGDAVGVNASQASGRPGNMPSLLCWLMGQCSQDYSGPVIDIQYVLDSDYSQTELPIMDRGCESVLFYRPQGKGPLFIEVFIRTMLFGLFSLIQNINM